MAHVDYCGPMADVYDAGRTLPSSAMDAWSEAARRHLGAGSGPVLDLGAGTGRFSAALAACLRVPVVALEPAAAMRDRARVAAGPVVLLVGGRAEELPFAAGVFSGVWASQVLHHVPDLDRAARELRRVLAPSGRVLVRGMLGHLDDLWPLAPYFPGAVRIVDERFPALDEISSRFEDAGLAVRAHDRVAQVTAADPEVFFERTSLRADSSLALLPDDEFATGLAHLRRDIDGGVLSGPVVEVLDLIVYG